MTVHPLSTEKRSNCRTATTYRDGRERTIEVAIFRDGAYQPCGRIRFNSKLNRADFTYHDDYSGPVLDPINLDYRRTGRRCFPVNSKTSEDLLHRVFIDYLPGPWGLRTLAGEFPEIKEMKAGEKLHWFGSRTVGSLAFYVSHLQDESPVVGVDKLERIRRQTLP